MAEGYRRLSPSRHATYKPFRFNVLRFAVRIEKLLEAKTTLLDNMGAIYSSLKLKRQRNKAMKRLVKWKLENAREYSLVLQQELERAESHLTELLRPSDTSLSCCTVSSCPCRTSLALLSDSGVDLDVLTEEQFNDDDHVDNVNERSCLLAGERCTKLDENLRLLEVRKEEVTEDLQSNTSKLDALQLKTESYRFRHYVAINPVELWSICSMPASN